MGTKGNLLSSGTTGLIALKLNRKFIGIEKNQETFEIAKVRINKQFLKIIYCLLKRNVKK